MSRTQRVAFGSLPPILMAKFGVYRMRDGSSYVLDCQADLPSSLNSRFVVLLMPIGAAPLAGIRLNPIFEIEGKDCAMVTQYAASVAARDLRDVVTPLANHDLTIGNALDLLISGF